MAALNGGSPVRLAKEPGDAFQRGPSWSPDGNSITYFSARGGETVLVRARIGSMERPFVIARNAGTYPSWSPDGRWIVSRGPGEGLTVISADGSARRTLGSGEWLVHGWSPDSRTVYGLKRTADRRLAVVAVSVAGGAETLTGTVGPWPAAFTYASAVGSDPVRGFSWSPDGRGFLTSMLHASGDLWVMRRL